MREFEGILSLVSKNNTCSFAETSNITLSDITAWISELDAQSVPIYLPKKSAMMCNRLRVLKGVKCSYWGKGLIGRSITL